MARFTVDGPFGGETYELAEDHGEGPETFIILHEDYALDLLTALSAKLGYDLVKKEK